VPDHERGKKDVVLVMPMQYVEFITKFEDFADDSVPYMYHCHLLHHEDDGMMGSFVVVDTTGVGVHEIGEHSFNVFPNPSSGFITIQLSPTLETEGMNIYVADLSGRNIFIESLSSSHDFYQLNRVKLEPGIYFVTLQSNQSFVGKRIIIHH
jgi:bilirubin oxidase